MIMKADTEDLKFNIGDEVKASPRLTNERDWVVGVVIDIIQNPFKGLVIAIEDKAGRIFFGESKYFSFA